LRAAPPIRPPAGILTAAAPERPARPARPLVAAARRPQPRPGPDARARQRPLSPPPVRPGSRHVPARDPGLEGVIRVDPRISARRIAVLREEGQRRLRRLLWLGGAIGAVALVLGSTRTPLLDLDHVVVTGADEAAAAEALASVGIRPGAPLVDIDLAAGERALEALPWVARAELQRSWPGTVEVAVQPRQPVAAVAVAGGTALVAADGVVVAVVSDAIVDVAVDVAVDASEPSRDAGQPGSVGASPTSLVPVDGPAALAPGDRIDTIELLTVAEALPDALRPMVAAVGAGDGAAELRLVDGGVVRLGAADQLDAKLLAAVTVLTQVDRACLAVLDVRVPSVPTVTRASSC